MSDKRRGVPVSQCPDGHPWVNSLMSHPISTLLLGSPPKNGLFRTIDPNVGVWGRVVQTFINHCFYGIFDPFLSNIFGKFMVNVPNLWCHPFQYLKNSSSLWVKKLLLFIANCYWPKVNLRSFEWESIQTRARNSLLIAPNNQTHNVLPPLWWTPSSIVGNIGWYEEFQLRQSLTL